ncbi:MAG TPA: leucyl/phenylalanyl-tRNA--protein transferase [Pseudolabrys sp.]|nr:leucyl/phenylalanyl-tRNA--protein transferase [Pseudolabrys sp.]
MAFHADQLTLAATAADPADRRASLFRESFRGMLERWALGTAWALTPARLRGVPPLLGMVLADGMAPDYALPDPESALEKPAGLCGVVHDLSVPTLLNAYRRGIYPWAHVGPLKWWSPPQRSVLFFNEYHIAKRLRRQMRQGQYTVTFDRDFEGVITACAAPREGRFHLTWITPRIMRAYAELFDAGHAHSFEVWNAAGELAGGGYGVALGGMFVTESQFSRETNTSKIGMTVLNWHLAQWGFGFNDGKLMTPTCRDMGFREIPRRDFLDVLARAQRPPSKLGRWSLEEELGKIAEWQPEKA